MSGKIEELSGLDKGADALRRHEQSGKRLNDWGSISKAQKDRWRRKAYIVLSACATTIGCEFSDPLDRP